MFISPAYAQAAGGVPAAIRFIMFAPLGGLIFIMIVCVLDGDRVMSLFNDPDEETHQSGRANRLLSRVMEVRLLWQKFRFFSFL